jgi:hypothetical protein
MQYFDCPPGDIAFIRGIIGLLVFSLVLKLTKDTIVPVENKLIMVGYVIASGIKVRKLVNMFSNISYLKKKKTM